MFKFYTSSGFWWPVDLHPVDDNGKKVTARIKVKFKRLDTDDVDAFHRGGFDPVLYADCVTRAGGDRNMALILLSAELTERGDASKTSEDRAEELMKIVEDWKEVQDADGNELEFSRDNLALLLRKVRSAYTDIKDGFSEAMSGEGKKGN